MSAKAHVDNHSLRATTARHDQQNRGVGSMVLHRQPEKQQPKRTLASQCAGTNEPTTNAFEKESGKRTRKEARQHPEVMLNIYCVHFNKYNYYTRTVDMRIHLNLGDVTESLRSSQPLNLLTCHPWEKPVIVQQDGQTCSRRNHNFPLMSEVMSWTSTTLRWCSLA